MFVTPHDATTLLISLLGSGVVAGIVSRQYERRRAKRLRTKHLAALLAEIDYCAKLAGTYLDSKILVPLYRFPTTVYKTVYASLVADVLDAKDIASLTAFYLQVDQMNRGLDAAADYLADDKAVAFEREIKRLYAKAREMRHQAESLPEPGESEFYISAHEVISRRLGKKK